MIRVRHGRKHLIFKAPVNIAFDEFTISLRPLDFRKTDMLDALLAIEFAVEIPRENYDGETIQAELGLFEVS